MGTAARSGRKLTTLQQDVVNQLLIDPSLKTCAEITGMSYSYVRKLAMRPAIRKQLQKQQDEIARLAEVSASYVLLAARETFERCMQRVPVMERDKDGKWVETGEWKFDSSGACKALDIMAKHKGVQAYAPEIAPPPAPAEGSKWTVKVVHMTKDQYDEQEGNGKPPIEHQP